MSTATAEPPKKPRLNLFTWDDLLEAYTRCGRDYELKREIHLEMRRRVSAGYKGHEAHAPLRLFHH